MKKIYLSLLSLGLLAGNMNAQTPEKKAMALFHKITATWCNPCGTWGWNLADEVKTATAGKALYMSIFASSSNSFDNTDFFNSTAYTLATQITYGGYPDFGVNAIERTSASTSTSGINTNGVKSDCIAAVDAFAATTPTASAASNVTISGNNVTVNAKVQFWSATSGEYYLAAYLIEEGALHIQNGQSGAVPHHGVLRASMTASSAWGEQIANGSITANQSYTKNFTFTVSDSKWDKTKLKVYNVIWKKEGGVYKFVNASLGGTPTAIEEVINTASVNIFPNPVAGSLSLEMDVVKSTNATLVVSDVTGRQVNSTAVTLKQGNNSRTINTASLTPGLYFLNIQTENGNIQKKFVKE